MSYDSSFITYEEAITTLSFDGEHIRCWPMSWAQHSLNEIRCFLKLIFVFLLERDNKSKEKINTHAWNH